MRLWSETFRSSASALRRAAPPGARAVSCACLVAHASSASSSASTNAAPPALARASSMPGFQVPSYAPFATLGSRSKSGDTPGSDELSIVCSAPISSRRVGLCRPV